MDLAPIDSGFDERRELWRLAAGVTNSWPAAEKIALNFPKTAQALDLAAQLSFPDGGNSDTILANVSRNNTSESDMRRSSVGRCSPARTWQILRMQRRIWPW